MQNDEQQVTRIKISWRIRPNFRNRGIGPRFRPNPAGFGGIFFASGQTQPNPAGFWPNSAGFGGEKWANFRLKILAESGF